MPLGVSNDRAIPRHLEFVNDPARIFRDRFGRKLKHHIPSVVYCKSITVFEKIYAIVAKPKFSACKNLE